MGCWSVWADLVAYVTSLLIGLSQTLLNNASVTVRYCGGMSSQWCPGCASYAYYVVLHVYLLSYQANAFSSRNEHTRGLHSLLHTVVFQICREAGYRALHWSTLWSYHTLPESGHSLEGVREGGEGKGKREEGGRGMKGGGRERESGWKELMWY